MTWTRSLLFLPPVVLGAALLALSISGREPPAAKDRAEMAEPVLFAEATPRAYAPRVQGFGEVRPARIWDAVAQVPGRVAELHPDFTRGGFIEEGELVGRIEDADYRLAVAQARLEIETARLAVEERRLSRETTRRLLEIEREALALARRELERQQDLARRGTAAAASVEAQERAVLTQRARVQDLENRLELAPVQIEELEQTLEVRRSRLSAAELDLARTELRAPFDARVAEVAVQQSQFAGAGASLGRLDGIGAAEVSAQVPPARMAGFARLAARGGATPPDREGLRASGLRAELRTVFQGVEASWEAEVRRISDVMDPETRSIGI
ncbi:MAG: HlyD family efflux transporter periplasmic adaptor subunit, partial [Pseudomonadota bacterium]